MDIGLGRAVFSKKGQRRHIPALDILALSLTALGAYAVDLTCAIMSLHFRARGQSGKDSAAAGLLVAFARRPACPDPIASIATAMVKLDAAEEVWEPQTLNAREAKRGFGRCEPLNSLTALGASALAALAIAKPTGQR